MLRAGVCLVAVLALAGPRPAFTQTAGSAAVIRGRVVDASGERPVAGARVHAASPSTTEGRTAYTDRDGAFELRALPKGRYVVTATKNGFVGASYGQPHPEEPGASIDVRDDGRIDRIDIRMSRAGVIAGRVTDDAGQGMGDVFVTASRYRYVRGVRHLVMAVYRRTTDSGDFRLFDLSPGQYIVAAALLAGPVTPGSSVSDVYAATYYPGTPMLAAAQAISIGPGQTVNRLEIPLRTARPFTVSGVVVDSRGQPIPKALVRAVPRMGAANGVNAGAKGDGRFTLFGLTAGDYLLLVDTDNMNRDEHAAVPVTIAATDVTGVRIVASPLTPISGRVLIAPDERDALAASPLRLSAPAATPDEASFEPEVPGISGSRDAAPVAEDLTFTLESAAGHVFLRPSTPGWFVRRVRINGVDMTDTPIDVRPDRPLTGVEIELTRRLPDVSGVVRNADGTMTRSAYVIVFPEDRARRGYLSRYVRADRPDPDHHYKIQLPAGDYRAIAVDTLEPGEWNDPAFLARVHDRAAPFTLRDGEHKPLDLRVQSMSKP